MSKNIKVFRVEPKNTDSDEEKRDINRRIRQGFNYSSRLATLETIPAKKNGYLQMFPFNVVEEVIYVGTLDFIKTEDLPDTKDFQGEEPQERGTPLQLEDGVGLSFPACFLFDSACGILLWQHGKGISLDELKRFLCQTNDIPYNKVILPFVQNNSSVTEITERFRAKEMSIAISSFDSLHNNLEQTGVQSLIRRMSEITNLANSESIEVVFKNKNNLLDMAKVLEVVNTFNDHRDVVPEFKIKGETPDYEKKVFDFVSKTLNLKLEDINEEDLKDPRLVMDAMVRAYTTIKEEMRRIYR